ALVIAESAFIQKDSPVSSKEPNVRHPNLLLYLSWFSKERNCLGTGNALLDLCVEIGPWSLLRTFHRWLGVGLLWCGRWGERLYQVGGDRPKEFIYVNLAKLSIEVVAALWCKNQLSSAIRHVVDVALGLVREAIHEYVPRAVHNAFVNVASTY